MSLSSEILREQREYERSATTVVNAYVRPLMRDYIAGIRGGLDGAGIAAPLTIMQSSGGVMTAEDTGRRPVLALESGPAAGVVAALGVAQRLGYPNAISFDMGGTTAKASLIEGGAVSRGREYEVGGSLSAGSRLMRGAGELLRIPTIDIAEVGAGGGSIAWLDAAGGLQVGPRSAGASPGPACYGRGGEDATVTDANVVLGLMPAGAVADGQITISAELAEEAVARVAEPLGPDAARGRRRHPRARERAHEPRAALGLVREGPRPARVRADRLRRRRAGARRRARRGARLPDGARAGARRAVLARSGCCSRGRSSTTCTRATSTRARSRRPSSTRCSPSSRRGSRRRSTACRSSGCAAPSSATAARRGRSRSSCRAGPPDLAALIAAFEDEHERLYGVRGEAGSPIVIRALRLAARGPSSAVDRLSLDEQPPDRPGTRTAFFGGDTVEAPVRTRASIGAAPEAGPDARRRVRHDGRRPPGLDGAPRRGDRDADPGAARCLTRSASRPVRGGSVPGAATWPERTCPFRPLGLPTSRPYAIEPTAEIVTCLQRKCANFVTIRPQGAVAPRRAARGAGGA